MHAVYKCMLISLTLIFISQPSYVIQLLPESKINCNQFVTQTEVRTRNLKVSEYISTMKILAIIFVCILTMFDAVQAQGCTQYETDGYVYIVKEENGDYYKIGASTDVATRVYNLQTGNPRKLEYVRLYRVTDCLQAENVAYNSVTRYCANLGGGTEWFHVVGNNNRDDFLERIHTEVLKQYYFHAWYYGTY